MDRIHYAGDSVLTGTAIAEALLEYAEALAKVDASATVDIPTRLEDGSAGRTKFLIGPASQLASDMEPSDYEEIVDDELVAQFRQKTEQLRMKARDTHRAAVVASPAEADDHHQAWINDL
jgi:hypothetical protein